MNMEFSPWHIWLVLALLLFIIEIFVPTFIAACIGFGCVIAGIWAYIGMNVEVQLLVFSITILIAFFGARPFLLNYAHRNSHQIRTNVDALVGKHGRVLSTIDNEKNEGRVSVEGEDWRGISFTNDIIEEGARIEVVKVNSTILTVKPLNS